MAKIKLTESVSVSELKHMREVEGLSNGEIARKLGCSINTIHAHIGTHPEGKRAKRKNKRKQLPSLPEKQIPDMPRESFKERCERLMAKEVEAEAEMAIASCAGGYKTFKRDTAPEPVAKIIYPDGEPKEADKAREAHCKALDMAAQLSHGIVPVIVHGTVYDVPRVAYEVIKEEALKINATEQKPEPLPCRPADNGNELHALVEELKVMFSPLSVLDYLKCKLYELGTPHIIYADREDYLTEIHRLLAMQEGVAQHD